MKTCTRCQKTFAYKMKNFYRDRTRADGFRDICKKCDHITRAERQRRQARQEKRGEY